MAPTEKCSSSFVNAYFLNATFQRSSLNKNGWTNMHSQPNHGSINGSCTGNLSMTQTNLIPTRQRQNQDTDIRSQTEAQVKSRSLPQMRFELEDRQMRSENFEKFCTSLL